jgi:hypothetical protein
MNNVESSKRAIILSKSMYSDFLLLYTLKEVVTNSLQ